MPDDTRSEQTFQHWYAYTRISIRVLGCSGQGRSERAEPLRMEVRIADRNIQHARPGYGVPRVGRKAKDTTRDDWAFSVLLILVMPLLEEAKYHC